MTKKILITAALPYVNNIQHLGHMVGCHLPADVFYKYNLSVGNDAIFVGGSDDHGTATLITAKELGITPDELCQILGDINRKIYKKLNIDYSINTGTNTPVHSEITQDFFKHLEENGYIEERDSTMLYCENDKIALADRFVIGQCPYCGYDKAYGDQCDKCGETYETTQLKDPKCKFCGEKAELRPTKHLYIKLDLLSEQLNEYIESRKDIWRSTVYKEAKRWIKEGLKPRAITRDIPWGIKVPKKGFEDKVFYVWFDAPIGYISITKQLGGEKIIKDYWQNPDCKIYNFLGKDNIPFHTVFFPAMQIGCGKYQNAYNVVGFSFMNFEGQKFSKSKKIGVFCDGILTSDIDIDALRGYLVTVFPEVKDSDFKWDGFKDNTNSELVGKYGNFFNRTLNMIYKNFGGRLDFELSRDVELSENDNLIIKAIKEYPSKIARFYQNVEFREAYKEIMTFASIGNTYLEKSAPWNLIKNGEIEQARKVLYLCLNLAKSLAIVAYPIIPNRTQEIWREQLNFKGSPSDQGIWKESSKIDISRSHITLAPKPLYSRIDEDKLAEYKEHFSKVLDIKNLKEIRL